MTDTNTLFANDAELKSIDRAKYNAKPTEAELHATVEALKKKGHNVILVDDAHHALAEIEKLIPSGKSVNTAGSTTLTEVGFTDALKANKHGWVNLKEAIVAETDPVKQADLRRHAQSADFHLTSVNSITHDGVLSACCLTGTRSGPLVFGPSHVIVVAGVNKIVKDLAAAEDRLQHYTLPVESARVRVAYASWGVKASAINFRATVEASNPFSPEKRFTVIIVKQVLGF